MASSTDDSNACKFNEEAKDSLLLTDNDPRFAPKDLINCEKCSRANPPDRTACIYCGQPFAASAIKSEIARISYQSPEPWELGYSLVYSGDGNVDTGSISAAGELLQIGSDKLERLLSLEASVPLIYLRSLNDADLLASRLAQIGFGCAIIGDDLLQANTPPTRVRSIIFDQNEVLLQDFNTEKFSPVAVGGPVLIVLGALLKTSTELKGKISKRVLKDAEESLAVSDEAVMDIYPPNDVYGFRIRAAGFDFSCLGEGKQQIAATNMTTLISELLRRFANGFFVDSFTRAAPLIENIWPLVETRQSGSVTRSTLGGVHKHKVTILDNNVQFTKFSRLQRHLK